MKTLRTVVGKHRLYIGVALVAALGYYHILVAPLVAATNPDAGAGIWVSHLASAEVDQAILRIGHLPLAYQRALIAQGSPDQRARAWRQLIADFPSRPGYKRSEAGEAALGDLVAFIRPERFDGRPLSPSDKAILQDLTSRAVTVFGRAALQGVIALPCQVVGKSGRNSDGLPLRERLAFYLRTHSDHPVIAAASLSWVVTTLYAQVPNCSCSVEADWCWDADCRVAACNTSEWGCGEFGLYQCNGLCYEIIEG
jgi:hypothetical protein